jgi:predicted RNase H-like HicB family nuclease
MQGSVVSYKVKLEYKVRLDGRDWLAWCPPLDIVAQARSKKEAIKSLQETVELWFESCIERNVLHQALLEVGFYKMKAGDPPIPEGASVVDVLTKESQRQSLAESDSLSSFIEARKGRSSYIEVSIPAYIAAQEVGRFARAPG